MSKYIRKYFLTACVLLAITTICSSIIQLVVQRKDFDSNTHILLRSLICFIVPGLLYLYKVIKLKNKVLQEMIHYMSSLALILLLIFCFSFFVEVGENPPYPVFALNFTGVYILAAGAIYFNQKKKSIERL